MLPGIRGAAGVVALVCCLALTSPRGAAAVGMDPTAAPPCPTEAAAALGAEILCFDEEPSGSATSAQGYPHVSVMDALVLSEADAAFLLGFDTASWATTGSQGIVNVLLPAVDFWFDAPATFFRIDVLGLPGVTGDPVPIVVQGFAGGMLAATILSDTSGALADGTHRDRLVLKSVAGFDHVRVFAALGPCEGGDCELGPTTSFFADTVKFIVPEPGAPALLGAGALLGAALRRRSAHRPEERS